MNSMVILVFCSDENGLCPVYNRLVPLFYTKSFYELWNLTSVEVIADSVTCSF